MFLYLKRSKVYIYKYIYIYIYIYIYVSFIKSIQWELSFYGLKCYRQEMFIAEGVSMFGVLQCPIFKLQSD